MIAAPVFFFQNQEFTSIPPIPPILLNNYYITKEIKGMEACVCRLARRDSASGRPVVLVSSKGKK